MWLLCFFVLDRVRAEHARWAVLHQVLEEVGARPYVVVYFNADADLPAIPDTSFMQELHTALDARHRDRLKVTLSYSPPPFFRPPTRQTLAVLASVEVEVLVIRD